MNAILASTLIDQINEGNKGEGDFKPQAYQAVVDKLRNDLGKFIMMDHAKIGLRYGRNIMQSSPTFKLTLSLRGMMRKRCLRLVWMILPNGTNIVRYAFSDCQANTMRLYPYVGHFVLLRLID